MTRAMELLASPARTTARIVACLALSAWALDTVTAASSDLRPSEIIVVMSP